MHRKKTERNGKVINFTTDFTETSHISFSRRSLDEKIPP